MLFPSPPTVIAGLTELQFHHPPTLELWDAWAFAEIDAEFALQAWWGATGGDRASAFAAYTAALEREEQAAVVLKRRLIA
jgi:hypothetical protein